MLYIVDIRVERGVAEAWQDWMEATHVQEVVDTGWFEDAVLARVPAGDTDERIAFRAIYRATSPEALDRYQAEDAARLKADHTDRFGAHVVASREILPVIGRFVPAGAEER